MQYQFGSTKINCNRARYTHVVVFSVGFVQLTNKGQKFCVFLTATFFSVTTKLRLRQNKKFLIVRVRRGILLCEHEHFDQRAFFIDHWSNARASVSYDIYFFFDYPNSKKKSKSSSSLPAANANRRFC